MQQLAAVAAAIGGRLHGGGLAGRAGQAGAIKRRKSMPPRLCDSLRMPIWLHSLKQSVEKQEKEAVTWNIDIRSQCPSVI